MEKILDLISREVEEAFEANGYDSKFGRVSLSNRPDLGEYQCTGGERIQVRALSDFR